jgi:hypothetical protein
MAIDRPGAIDAALGFEPERSGGRRGADLFGARGMPAQPAGERSRRLPLRQHADQASNPIVGETVREESSMTAIVLDHEQSHEKARSWHREQDADAIVDIQGCPHQKPRAE